MNPGIYYDLKEDEYHKLNAFSYSGAKEFAKSPAHYKAYINREQKLDPDREFYKAVHALCLEGTSSNIEIVDGTWAGAVKEKVIGFKNQGKIVVKQKDFDQAKVIAVNIKNNKYAEVLLNGAKSEVTIIWNDKLTGVLCKARIDVLNITQAGSVIADLKNFDDISSEQLLTHQVFKNKYHWQAAHYSNAAQSALGKQPTSRHFIWAEGKAPFGVKVRNCPESFIEIANKELSELMIRFKSCLDKNEWPAYEDNAIDSYVPEWIKNNTAPINMEF